VDPLDQIRQYCDDVISGAAVAGECIQLIAARTLAELDGDRDVWWDGAELERIVEFVGLLKLHDSRNAPAQLYPWQLHLVGGLLARRRRSDDEPATRFLALEIGKGNAKSTTAAMISLYLLASSPHRVEVWSLATKRDQAHRIVENTTNFAFGAEISTEHGGDIQCKFREILNKKTRSIMGSIATKQRTADGLLGRLYIADECGRFVDDTLGKLIIATHKLPDAQILMLTTPGQDRTNTYYQRRDEMEQQLRDGELGDDRFPLLYGIDAEDDPFDVAVWPKGNPMLAAGVLPIENMRSLAKDAKSTLKGRSEFTREICCRYDDRDAAFIDLALWDKAERDFDPLEVSKGRRVIGAADLSKRHDLTAVVFAVNDGSDSAYIWGHAWTCEHELDTRERLGNMPYRQWAEEGHLTICPGQTIDLDAVQAYLEEWADRVELWKVYVDPVSGAADTLEKWRQDGLPIEAHRQNMLSMSPPLQNLATRIRAIEKPDQPHVYHDGWPVLRQSIRNVRVREDWSGNPTAEKDKAAGRIDPFIAAVMSMTGIMEEIRKPRSVYESSSVI
jgi:phage terminase large subunit-like protein